MNKPNMEEKVRKVEKCIVTGKQADTAQESISTAVFGTSMSAQLILGLKKVPRVRLFAD